MTRTRWGNLKGYEMEEMKYGNYEEVFLRVAEAVELAAVEHGADVVGLAIMAYRIEAAQSILFGLLCLIPFFLIKRFWQVVIKYDDTLDALDRGMAINAFFLCSAIYSVFATIVVFSELTLLNIAAAFGYPELMIAANTLKAGGLL